MGALHATDRTYTSLQTNTLWFGCLCQYPGVPTDDFIIQDRDLLANSHKDHGVFYPTL